MADEIRRLTELLARDPSNMAFRDLAELLRVRGEVDSAYRVAIRGLERHTLDAESHALLARICIDRGELQRAFDEWDMALRLAPRHLGALKGLGFISYRWGKLQDAERYLVQAIALAPTDSSLVGALQSVQKAQAALPPVMPANASGRVTPARAARRVTPGKADGNVIPANADGNVIPAKLVPAGSKHAPADGKPGPGAGVPVGRAEIGRHWTPVGDEAVAARLPLPSPANGTRNSLSPQELFASAIADTQAQALLVDSDGLIVAGSFRGRDGTDRGQEIGAELSGVSDEANRAMRHLRLGDWKSITFESDNAVFALARADGDSLVVVASERATPLGLLRRALEKAQAIARKWLEGEKGGRVQ